MLRLERLTEEHATALLEFERVNRAYFVKTIPDRGDAYFEEFAARHAYLLANQEAGLDHFHLVLDAGEIVARINLIEVADGSAELGFRVAEAAAGRGVATFGVREACARARSEYGLKVLRAQTTVDNLGSQGVLAKTGFVRTGEITLDGRPGYSYLLHL